jgi:hypothetical protein
LKLPWTRRIESAWTSPPLPALMREEHQWVGKVLLPSWAEAPEEEDGLGGDERCDGIADLVVDAVDQTPEAPVMSEQVHAVQYLLDNEPAVCDAIVAAVFSEYPQIRRDYEWTREFNEDWDDMLPAATDPKEVWALLCPSSVYVWELHRDGFAYVGIEFGCTWDEDHGFGIAMHKDRILEMGYGEVHFCSENVRREAGEMR